MHMFRSLIAIALWVLAVSLTILGYNPLESAFYATAGLFIHPSTSRFIIRIPSMFIIKKALGGRGVPTLTLRDQLFYAAELCFSGPRERNYLRTKLWVLYCSERQAEALGTSVERFRREHFDPTKLQQATSLSNQQVAQYANTNKVDSGTVGAMHRLIERCSLSSGMGKPGSPTWAPHLTAVALTGLDSTPRERDWRFLLFSALCELVRQRSPLPGDARIALDAAYIVMLYFHLGPSASAAARFAAGLNDELIRMRVDEAEDHLLETLPWR